MTDSEIGAGDADYMTDWRGAKIPVAAIKPEDIEQDALVRELVAEAERLSAALAAFKLRALGDVAAFQELIAEKYGAKRGGTKGNVTLTSFDGRLQVQVQIGENVAFGPELQAAKALIDRCVERWASDANDNLKALVDHAFQVNKAGRIDTHRVLGLRRLAIEDVEWSRAMEAIGDSLRVTGTKTYFRCYRRDPLHETVTPIPLDLARV